jgi:hypothetical protein
MRPYPTLGLLYLSAYLRRSPKERAWCFAPSDEILRIYYAPYPIRGWPDALELESLARQIEGSYGFRLRELWRGDLTMGDLFSKTQHLVR